LRTPAERGSRQAVAPATVPSRRRAASRWFTPLEARDPLVLAELMNRQSTLLLQALAHLGV
jgi:hypothetical protein